MPSRFQRSTASFWLILAASRCAAAGTPAEITATVRKHCLQCHDADSASGGIVLDPNAPLGEFYKQGPAWKKAARVLRDREMPPEAEPQPSDEDRRRLVQWIDQSLAESIRTASPDPGRPTMRRLNRTEFRNTIRDLTGLTGDFADELPVDPAGYGFDKIGDVLFLPPVLVEKYFDVTRVILDRIYADPSLKSRLVSSQSTPQKNPRDAAREVLAKFTPLAFRRPTSDAEIEDRLKLYDQSASRGSTYEASLRVALQSVLMSPSFLFRVETDRASTDAKTAYRVTDHELTVRLSYFLWSTTPDEELSRLAREGKLSDPSILRAQVKRMLSDPKGRALSEDFAAQWLRFREIQTLGVDFRSYPAFNDALRNDMYAESSMFCDLLFRENRSILEILDSDYVYVNDRLAKHYGIPGVDGGQHRRVKLPDGRRGGVLGMGSILTVTSYPTRTSPVLRGKWVLEELLGAPPPPPPPNTPALPNAPSEAQGKTVRERLGAHRAAASCAACHRRIDPLGFALENFDGIGSWRDKEQDKAIDSVGELPDKVRFEGPAELRKVLLARKDRFVRTMVEKMFTYAIGRPPEFYDEPVIRTIIEKLERDGFRAQTLVQEITASYPFQHRRNAGQ